MKRKGAGCLSWIVGLGAFGLVVYAFDVIGDRIDRARFPWGYETPGKSTLAGTWVGPVTTGSGQRLGFLIEMRLAPLDYHRKRSTPILRTRRSTWLIGKVLTCTGPGRPNEYTLDGDPDDNKASSFRLGLRPRADSLNTDGLAPSHIKGRWDGGDSIDLLISLHLHRYGAAITSSAHPDTGPDQRATLTRGTEVEFTALCRRLTG
jgi:hypothetical protein